ncbi:MAG TPA: DoxX family protein [Polyangiaceae bacterium]
MSLPNLDRHASFGPLALRLGLGGVFVAHAYAKAAIYTFPGTVQFFEAQGFPGFMAYPVFATELVAGLALMAGFGTRWAALALMPVMLGALKPHLAAGWMFTSPGGGWEYIAFLLAALVAQFFVGSGAYAAESMRSRQPVEDARAGLRHDAC